MRQIQESARHEGRAAIRCNIDQPNGDVRVWLVGGDLQDRAGVAEDFKRLGQRLQIELQRTE